MPEPEIPERNFRDFLAFANVTTLEEPRQLDSAAIIQANALQIRGAEYGAFTYGPTVDGIFVPALPGQLLNDGAHAKDIELMTCHNANEGAAFVPPDIRTTEDLEDFIKTKFPGISDTVVDTIVNKLYPPVFDGALPYTNNLERAWLMLADSLFTCDTNYLNKAFNNQTYAYRFEVPPSLHGQDVAYTFYNDGLYRVPVIDAIAEIQKGYIVSFGKLLSTTYLA